MFFYANYAMIKLRISEKEDKPMHLKRSPKMKSLFLGALTTLVLNTPTPAAAPRQMPAPRLKTAKVIKDNYVKAFEDGRATSFSDYLNICKDFDYDTLRIDKGNAKKRICLGQYRQYKDKIEIKYFLTDYTGANARDSFWIARFDKYNMEQYVNGVKIHELCHLTFHRRGNIKKIKLKKQQNALLPRADAIQVPQKPKEAEPFVVNVGTLSLSDLAIIGQYNEIGAEIGRRIYERERYLKSRNIKEFFKSDAYTDAVESGQIHPGDTSAKARLKEYALLANAVFDRWLEKEKKNYAYSSLGDVKGYINKAKVSKFMIPEKSDPDDFKRRVSTCFTFPIDGKMVDFSAFILNRQMSPQPMVQRAIDAYSSQNKLYRAPEMPFQASVPPAFLAMRGLTR